MDLRDNQCEHGALVMTRRMFFPLAALLIAACSGPASYPLPTVPAFSSLTGVKVGMTANELLHARPGAHFVAYTGFGESVPAGDVLYEFDLVDESQPAGGATMEAVLLSLPPVDSNQTNRVLAATVAEFDSALGWHSCWILRPNGLSRLKVHGFTWRSSSGSYDVTVLDGAIPATDVTKRVVVSAGTPAGTASHYAVLCGWDKNQIPL